MALTYDMLNSVTIPYYQKVVAEQVYDSNVVLSRIRKGGRVLLKATGGLTIDFPINTQRLGDAEWIDPDAARVSVVRETVSKGSVGWKWLKTDCVVTWEERTKNSGPEAVVNLVKYKLEEGKKDTDYAVNTALYQAYADIGSLEPDSFFSFLRATATSYAGISQSDVSDWDAGLYDIATASLALYGTTGSLHYLIDQCTFGERPDLMITTKTLAGIYGSKLQPGERRGPEEGAAGATDFYFEGIPIAVEYTGIAANTWICTNTKNLWLAAHKDFDFSIGKWTDDPDRYNALRLLISFAGNFFTSCRRTNGCFTALTG